MNYARLLTDVNYAIEMVRETDMPTTEKGRSCWVESEHVLVNLRNAIMDEIAKFEVPNE